MLVIALVKGVPANTARVVTIGGVLRREEMDIVLNPYDRKTIEAADYIRRLLGGKLVALSMGPHPKIIPIMNELFGAEVEGIDEAYILSDRRMAGADTLATSYTLALGIKKILDLHRDALAKVRSALESGDVEQAAKVAEELYNRNLIPNIVYNDKPPIMRQSIIWRVKAGQMRVDEAVKAVKELEDSVYRRFIIVAGLKASDGETGHVGPQTAEALSEILGITIPHTTYVTEFSIVGNSIIAKRRFINYIQTVQLNLPAVITIHTEYRSPAPPIDGRREARLMMFKGKNTNITIWNADDIKADPVRIGLAGSPTVVGPGVDLGRPIVRKIVNKTLIFAQDVDKVSFNGKEYGPFRRGDVADGLPPELIEEFKAKGIVKTFTYDDLAEEIIKILAGR